jgi:hypothetical protein
MAHSTCRCHTGANGQYSSLLLSVIREANLVVLFAGVILEADNESWETDVASEAGLAY